MKLKEVLRRVNLKDSLLEEEKIELENIIENINEIVKNKM